MFWKTDRALPGPTTPTVLAVVIVVVIFGAMWSAHELDESAGPVGTAPVASPANAVDTAVSGPRTGSRTEREAVVQPTTAETTTTTVAPRTESVPVRDSVTMAFAGDVLPHMPLSRKAAEYGRYTGQPYDYTPMFASMEPILGSVDLAICHIEVPLHPEGEAPSGYPSFGAPAELVAGIRSGGYDGCSTASNHSLDRGRRGIDRLLDEMDRHELRHNGTARNPADGGGLATFYEVDGVRIAHMSWSYGFNGYVLPEDAPWAANLIDVDRILLAAAKARADGADLVVVSLHWGQEYRHDPTPSQERIAQQLTASSDVDLIIGHHAHVVQPISKVNDTFVVWGLGNQLSNQRQLTSRDGLTVQVHANRDPTGRWQVVAIDAIPTFVDVATFRVIPVVEALRWGEPLFDTAALRASYGRTAGVLARRPTEGVAIEPLP